MRLSAECEGLLFPCTTQQWTRCWDCLPPLSQLTPHSSCVSLPLAQRSFVSQSVSSGLHIISPSVPTNCILSFSQQSVSCNILHMKQSSLLLSLGQDAREKLSSVNYWAGSSLKCAREKFGLCFKNSNYARVLHSLGACYSLSRE